MFVSTCFLGRFTAQSGRIVRNNPNTPPPMMAPLAAVTPRATATKTSTGAGDWNAAGTWTPPGVPGAGDKVLIQSGHTVTMKGNNTAQLEWVLVEGTLTCDTTADSFIRAGSVTFATGSSLEFGTLASPVPSNVTAEIQIADLGDLDPVEDYWLLGRGINFAMMSTFKVYGAGKLHAAMMAADAAVTDTSVVLDRNLVDAGWKVGDRVVIGNDTYKGFEDNVFQRHESEERTITSFSTTTIANDTINFTGGLSYTHAGNPTVLANGSLPDLRPYVVNTERNIKFTAENPSTIQRHQRPHLMIHPNSTAVDVRYLEVVDFGRTSRGENAIEVWDVDQGTLSATTNVNGRYGFHFHFVGTDDAAMKDPPILVGLVVRGSTEGGPMPGWGIVQHQSCGVWYRCVTDLVKGSGMAAEDGNERGVWKECLSIRCEGWNTSKTKNWSDEYEKKAGHNGSGFFSAGRELRIMNCIAQDCQWGFDAFHRPVNSDAAIDITDLEIPEINISDPAELPLWSDFEIEAA